MGTFSSSLARASSDDNHLSLMTAAATGKYERAISWLRTAFCAANLLLSAWTWELLGNTHITRILVPLGLVVIVSTAAFAIFIDIKVRRGVPIATRTLAISISVDILITFAALLGNPYWAENGYYGIVRSPDIGALLLLVIASGFRLHFWLSVLSGSLASIAYLLLLWADHVWAAEYAAATFEQELFFGMEIVFSTAMACAISSIGHSQVERVAMESIDESRRGRRLDALLTGLHRLENKVTDLNWVVEQEGFGRNKCLRESAEAVHGSCKEVRKAAETSAGGEISSVGLRDVLERAVQEMRGRSSRDVAISLTDDTPLGTTVDVHGGATALYDMMVCLIHNGAEGSGVDPQARRSRNIEVHAAIDWVSPYVRIDVRDDGPGFAKESMLGRATTKGEGHGTGLVTVRKYATRSLGSLRCRNIGSRGAEVTLWLPDRSRAVAPASGRPQ